MSRQNQYARFWSLRHCSTMASGTLPLATYHRAQALGEGTFGSVVAVYNDDGQEYALKLFLEEEDDEDEEMTGMDLGAMREISILRILREENGHENIVPMADVKNPEDFEEEDLGAGTSGCLAMAMPLYKSGTLADAMDKGVLRSCPKRVKVAIAHEFLCAVAYLHDNGIIHRDIKSDNIMLEEKDDGSWRPVLIDFSLAKLVEGTIYAAGRDMNPFSSNETEMTHTSEVGTVTYTAPEIVEKKTYSLPSDLWSVGVILLEMLQNHTLEALKNKEGFKQIEELKQKLPDQPFANLVRGLLRQDPEARLTARQALESRLFSKFGLEVPPVRLINVHAALPLENGEEEEYLIENAKPNKSAGKKAKKNPVLVKRMKLIRKLCNELDCKHPMTAYAALVFSQQMFLQIDDELDDLTSSQTLLDCVVLASKFFETELLDLDELEGTGSFKNWSVEEYYDNEGTIWMLMDHCLYPRGMDFDEY